MQKNNNFQHQDTQCEANTLLALYLVAAKNILQINTQNESTLSRCIVIH